MILKCPSCETRYALDPAKLGDDGRRVKCARCGHIWFATPPEDAERVPPPPEPPLEPAAEGASSTPFGPAGLRADRSAPPPSRNLPAKRGPSIPRSRALSAAAGLLILALLAGLVIGRDQVAAAWPATEGVYQALGLDVAVPGGPVPGAGLALIDVIPELTESEGERVLWVRGAITNPSDTPRTVPPFRVTLLNADREPLDSWSFEPEVDRLAPGEAATFATRRDDPDPAATEIEVMVDRESQ
jgi:predicted Zn finger-like uncharacterized protein